MHQLRMAALGVLVAAGLSVTGPASAASILGLYNTGINSAGTGVTVGDVADPHWLLQYGSETSPAAPYNSVDNINFPIPYWLLDNATSRWATPTPNAADSFDPNTNGFYIFTLDFNLLNTAGAAFTAQFAADNAAYTIDLNGNLLASGLGGFSSWTPFAATSADFVSGTNVLTIDVENYAQNGGNPSGLNVEFLSSTAGVPEPAVWTTLLLGFFGVGFMLRRNRNAPAFASA